MKICCCIVYEKVKTMLLNLIISRLRLRFAAPSDSGRSPSK